MLLFIFFTWNSHSKYRNKLRLQSSECSDSAKNSLKAAPVDYNHTNLLNAFTFFGSMSSNESRFKTIHS